jgi:O-methyltransferase
MLAQITRRWIHPLRVLAGRFVILPESEDGNFTGQHGCINTAASFVTWNRIPGDYLEFGVYKGGSFAAAYRAIMRNRATHLAYNYASEEYREWQQHHPRFFAFDSFEGLPGGPAARMADYLPGAFQCTEEIFKSNIADLGVDLNSAVVVPGFYDRTLNGDTKTRHELRKAAVVMIDCDLYESTVPVLDFLTDILVQGSVIIFHDWFRFKGNPDCGEQRACREWLQRNPQLELIEYWREGPQAVSFLVNFR